MELDILAILVAFLILILPGIALSFAILRGIKFNWADKVLMGIVLGFLANPLLSFLEFLILGIKFSSGLVFVNALLILIFSFVIMFLQKQLSLDFSGIRRVADVEFYKKKLEERPLAILVYVALIAIMGMAFYVRFETGWNPRFFEFDPYYYDLVTQQIIKDGSAPLQSDNSYFPRFRSFRELPIMHYMTASWYSVYQDFGAKAFDQDTMISIIQFYPPIMGALLVFLAYLFIREESNKYLGLVAAMLFAFTPQLIKKMGAGVSEQAPFGMFAAMLVFAIYAIAINRKSIRLGMLAAFSMLIAMLGSAHYIWPLTFIGGFVLIISFLEFATGQFERNTVFINIMLFAAAVLGNLLLIFYKGVPLAFGAIYFGVLVFGACLVPSIVFLLAEHFRLTQKYSRKMVIGGVIFTVLVLSALTPLGSQGIGHVNSLLLYATTGSPLVRTIQEENATDPALFPGSFGVLNPPQLLLASTALLVILAMLALRKKGIYYSAGYGALAFILIALNAEIDKIFSFLAKSFQGSLPEVSTLFNFIITSDVFLYLIISVISVSVYYIYEEKNSKMALLFLLTFFPTAYIGLNKVKYLLHLAFALALALPFVLMMITELFTKVNSAFKLIENKAALQSALLVIVMVIGSAAGISQLNASGFWETFVMGCHKNYTPQCVSYGSKAMAELQGSRISPDWNETTYWMQRNLDDDARVISWWDYGHWTAFFGDTKTVLDPSNYYEDYDQLTARGFVDGNTSFLIDVMHYHNATHILVDSELVPKWGALVYLSGTFKGLVDGNPRFALEPKIASTERPGGSQYEMEHYFEYVYGIFSQSADGKYAPVQCPGVIPKRMYYSSFGAAYCIDTNGKMFMLGNDGTEKPLNDTVPVRADDSRLSPVPLQGANLFYNAQYSFISLNPDLATISGGKTSSKLFDAAFVKLFFLEKLDGFELVYKSPNSQVKIFRLLT